MFDYASRLFGFMRRLLNKGIAPIRWYFVEHYKHFQLFVEFFHILGVETYLALEPYVARFLRYGYIFIYFLCQYAFNPKRNGYSLDEPALPVRYWFLPGTKVQSHLGAQWAELRSTQMGRKEFLIAWCNSWTIKSTVKWIKSWMFWRKKRGRVEWHFGKPRPLAHLVEAAATVPYQPMQQSLLLKVGDYVEYKHTPVDEVVRGEAGPSETKEEGEAGEIVTETGMKKQKKARKRNKKRK